MEQISLKELLEAGCHFGHQSQRWNPKASSFIYTKRDGIHIIDLVKTRDGLTSATSYIKDTLAQGGTILFVGTKRQAKDIMTEEAKRAGAFYVTEHWPAGFLTNFEVLKKNLAKMHDLEGKLGSQEKQQGFTKREIGLWEKELKKLLQVYGGIAELVRKPDILFVVDVKHEAGAVKEAKRMGVTVVGIVDTNSDPTFVDYVIPANDDAVGSIKILVKYIADATAEGMMMAEKARIDVEENKIKDQKAKIKNTDQKSNIKVEEKIEEPIKLIEEPKKAQEKKPGKTAKEKAVAKKAEKNKKK